MKHLYLLFTVAITLLFHACSNDYERMELTPEDGPAQISVYPEKDNSDELSGTTCSMVRTILQNVASNDFAKTLGNIEITNSQYKEIAEFTDDLVKDCATDFEKYDAAYKWIVNNIKYVYRWVDNRPYAVFTTKEAICQGYADLLTVMMHTQNIPCFTINGELYQPGYADWYLGGHAWNYVYADSWYISDPTNGSSSIISATTSYAHLRPTTITIPIYEDDICKYNFNESQLCVYGVKANTAQVTIPYSVNGIKVTSLNIQEDLPDEVREIYIGSNIKTLGTSSIGLSSYASNVEALYVDHENEYLESYSNVIYSKNGSDYTMLVVAPKVTSIELKAIETFDKESKLKNLQNLETITFVQGTKTIGAWTVEYCPNLHTVYVPEETVIEENAFTGVASHFKIVRSNFTNIPEINL